MKPGYALLVTKSKLLPKKSALALQLKKSALEFAQRGHSFPFSHWERAEVAFWPGCSLGGTSPTVVKTTLKLLKRHLPQRKVGLILDCCFDPLYQLGAFEDVNDVWKDFKGRFEYFGIKRVITGCFNCYKIFNRFGENVKVDHVLVVLPRDAFSNLPDFTFLHLPCPLFQFEDLRQRICEKFSIDRGKAQRIPACCGAGGGACFDKEVSESFLRNALVKASSESIITLCMGCKNRFLRTHPKSFHLLEFLPGIELGSKPLSSLNKWLNRLWLSLWRKLFNSKGLIFLFLLTIIIFAIGGPLKVFFQDLEDLRSLLLSLSHNPLSYLLYLFFYAIAPSLFITSLGLTLLAGFLWGPLWGAVFALTGATLGATVSFLLSRYLFKDALYIRLGVMRWNYIKKKTEQHGWKALAFARLFPFFPFPVINYLFGLTPISLKAYVLTTFFFMMPACFAYTFFGYSLQELILNKNFLPLIFVLILLTILSVILKALNRRWKI
ncbi:MAG: VTT domain-containing protein [Caldimicrobium sp.]|nr:VTT domain-containing protein [Caldimicrobium sp.]MDW8183544.1 VTT domain-containing protein [Caldimicrobium sp.]